MIYGQTLSLESWRETVGINPYHFWGWTCNTCKECCSQKKTCDKVWFNHYYQGNTAGRQDVREALTQARNGIHAHFEAWVGTEFIEEVIDLPPAYNRGFCCELDAYQLCENHIQAVGVQAVSKIGDNLTVEYLTETGAAHDFSSEFPPCWFRVTFTQVDGPNLEDLALFHIPAFGQDVAPTDLRFIASVKWTKSGDTYTGLGRPWLMAKPELYEKADCKGLDCATESNYVTDVELHEITCEEMGTTLDTAAVTLFREDGPCGCNECCDDIGQIISVGSVRNGTNAGYVTLSDQEYDADTGEFESNCCTCRCWPNRAKIRYKAGLEGDGCINIAPAFHMLATGLLPRICNNCNHGTTNESYFDLWTRDYSQENDPDLSLNLPFDLLENPFGLTHGAAFAYQKLKKDVNLRVARAVVF